MARLCVTEGGVSTWAEIRGPVVSSPTDPERLATMWTAVGDDASDRLPIPLDGICGGRYVSSMPRLASLDGVDIYMYFKDHAPPHVHAFHGDDEALVLIRDGAVYVGAIPGAKLLLVQSFVEVNRVELLARWATYGGG